jgi:hypothetical protein
VYFGETMIDCAAHGAMLSANYGATYSLVPRIYGAAEAKYRCRENQAACNTARRIVWGSVAATKDSFGYK